MSVKSAPKYRDVSPELDLPGLEHRILKFWEENRCFQLLREQNAGKPPWSFLDGPITANNPMGVHHAWGRSYKDMFCRFHAMQGRELRYQNGFDCQGLWVEVEVEKELGFKSKRDIERYGIAEFVERCKERARRFAAVQTAQSIRLGYWMDWENSYYTMSDENNYTIWAFLKRCHEHGWVYKGRDVMPWCARCGTGLSQHEIATEGYRELTHVSPYVRFPLKGREREYLLVWTTTPWTLSSNVAAAVHPNKRYSKVKQGDAIYYLIESREHVLKERGAFERVESLLGSELVGLEYDGPFDELEAQNGVKHRVVAWEEVTDQDGTGIVHIAPGCGKEDFELSKHEGLAVIAPLDEYGVFGPAFGPFANREASTILDDVLANLKAKGLLYKQERYTHSYPVCWRCGSELLFRLVDEWYIRMGEQLDKPDTELTAEEKASNLRYQIMDSARQATWIPSYGLDREIDWLRNMHDWMISKKRYWGLALPIFECSSCGKFDVIGGREELRERAVSGWSEFEGNSPHRPWVDGVVISCKHCGGHATRIKDVGNPWLDAGIVGFSTMQWRDDPEYWKKWYPAELVTESFPGQFRNWFYSLLAMGTVLSGQAPFRRLFGYALMKAQDGREMHKSWGNSIEFNEAADKAGVDAMRWLFASHIPDQNLLFGYDAVDEARRKFLTLWNVYSFFVTYAKIDGFDPQSAPVPLAQRPALDRWILGGLQRLVTVAHSAWEQYQLHTFMRQLEKFIDELSTWYVRRSRRRFWKSETGADKLAAYQTLHEVLVTVTELLAPITPFVSEEMYQNLVRSWDESAPVSVHHRSFPSARSELVDAKLAEDMAAVLQIVELGRRARQNAAIKVRQPLAKMAISLPAEMEQSRLAEFESHILEELNIKAVEYMGNMSPYLRRSLKLDARKAGPRLGAATQSVLAAVRKLPPEQLASHTPGAPLEVTANGVTYTLTAEELVLDEAAVAGFAYAGNGRVSVLLTTEITEDLRREGAVRDVIRLVQEMRKNHKLEVADRISLELEGSEAMRNAVQAQLELLKRETLAVEVNFRAT
ncbi:MAG TPA: isoleucine--tRNA ligase, partial [Polyangiaceae bacterium]|nr:isoleucine--tRNA ligase [Polyangiaceae bacterium]